MDPKADRFRESAEALLVVEEPDEGAEQEPEEES